MTVTSVTVTVRDGDSHREGVQGLRRLRQTRQVQQWGGVERRGMRRRVGEKRESVREVGS